MSQQLQINDILHTMMNARKTLEHCENLLRDLFDKQTNSFGILSGLPTQLQLPSLPPLPPLPTLPSLNVSSFNYLQKQPMVSPSISQLSPSSPSFEVCGVSTSKFSGDAGFKSILFPEKHFTSNSTTTFLEIINTEILKKDDDEELLKKLPKSMEKVFYSTQEQLDTEKEEILTPLKKNKKKFKLEKFQQNVIKILMNEFTSAKLENREILPMLPPLLKSRLDFENMPPKKSPHNESFTTLISQIKEVQILWIRRNSLKDESLLEPERAYVLSKEFITNYFG